MNRNEVIQELKLNHQAFADWINGLNDVQYTGSYNGKWSPGQHMEHIYKAVRPVTLAFGLPSLLLRVVFGEANRPGRTYDGLVNRYQDKLAKGGKAGRMFIPHPADPARKTQLNTAYFKAIDKLCNRASGYSEEQLDYYILPHPLLGKLTLREMLYFTNYHVQHHHKNALHQLASVS